MIHAGTEKMSVTIGWYEMHREREGERELAL